MTRRLCVLLAYLLAVGQASAQNPPTAYAPYATPYDGTESWYCEKVSAVSNGRCQMSGISASISSLPNLTSAPLLTTTGVITSGGATGSGFALNVGTISYTGTIPNAALSFTLPLSIANGGTGTNSPALVSGTGITITGAWPNQTVALSAGGGCKVNVLPANPTQTTSATATMQGLGLTASSTCTPNRSGNVLFIINGQWNMAAVAYSCFYQLYEGTGVAPANGAAVTGTSISSTISLYYAASQGNFVATGLATGLTLGTAYWFDIALRTGTAPNGCQLSNITMTAVEL